MKLSVQDLHISGEDTQIAWAYTNTSTPVSGIIAQYGISYYTLYRILRLTGAQLRCPPKHTIIVLDEEVAPPMPIEVDKTPATLALRRRQLVDLYYNQRELVSEITRLFGIGYKTLYRICPANRRNRRVVAAP
jgi:DNA invertase Pin-like site-specific DNA recombinase